MLQKQLTDPVAHTKLGQITAAPAQTMNCTDRPQPPKFKRRYWDMSSIDVLY